MSEKIKNIENFAKTLRREIAKMTTAAQSGHPGGSFSCSDIMAALYYDFLKVDPCDPHNPNRDVFILSKGHAAPALYAALSEKGFFSNNLLCKLRKTGETLQGHPAKHSVPGIEMSTGSLGQGISVAVGAALSKKLDKVGGKVVALLGDGENQEGIVWEAAMAGAHYKLDNLIAIIDRNFYQIDGPTEKVMGLAPLEAKWMAFGWEVISIDGHDIKSIVEALEQAKTITEKPTMIIANTVKGKGVSFMENQNKFHGVALTIAELEKALEELK